MDHKYIEEHYIITRYEIGELSAEESALFEEHFADCQTCQEQAERSQDLRRVLKKVTADDEAKREEPVREVLPFRRGRAHLSWDQTWRPMLIAAAACVVFGALPAIFAIRHLHNELNQSRNEAETFRQQYGQEHQAALALRKQVEEASQKMQAIGASSPQPTLASLFTLDVVRSSDGSEPVNQIAISRLHPSIILSIDQDPAEGFQSYRITLEDSAGNVLWTISGIQRSRTNAFGITVPSSLFHQGNYLLKLEGLSPKGTYVSSGHYPFHVKVLP